MSLMLRLLSTTLLLSSFAAAQTQGERVADFLEDKFIQNPRLKSVDVNVIDEVPLTQIKKYIKGWNAYIIDVEATLKGSHKRVKQKMIWFSDGNLITKELTDMRDGSNLTELVKPKFQDAYYKKENLVYGHADAKHKVAIFSDPLCPFCRSLVPPALEYMKKYPDTFAIYYYHFPLENLHPASVDLVKMAVAAEKKGVKDALLKLYKIKINPRERDTKKILAAFNKAVGTHLTQKDIEDKAILDQIKNDAKIADDVMVAGTPTLYFDGKVDRSKAKYKKVKVEE